MRNTRLMMTLVCILAAMVFVAACERTVTTVNETYTASQCFDCHSDQNTKLVAAEAQWSYSVHGSGDNINRNTTPCQQCHTSDGFVAKVTGASIPNPVVNPTAIHCFTCHAPHTNSNLTLRVTAPQSLENGESFDMNDANICAACHHARQNVNTYIEDPTELSEHWGPHHSPQSDMLWGSNGYEYAGYQYEQTNHKGATEDGCLDCHFKATRNYIVGGHSFNMMFVADGDTTINSGGCSCHSSSVDDFNHHEVQDSVHTLVEDLKARLIAAGLVDATGHPLDDVFTSPDSAGAVWNFLMVEEDRSMGVHNADYIIGLLNSAIQFIQTGPTPAAPAAGKAVGDEVAKRE
jgi:hypothetical protein